MKNRLDIREITYIALGTALICVCAWLSIPLSVPVPMQSFAVCLLAALLGLRGGMWCVLLYILLGAVGLPVFSLFRGGLGVLLGAGGGYIFGFLLTAAVVGHWAEKHGRTMHALILSMALGIILCYVSGTLWYALVYTQGERGMGMILALCVLPYIVPDGIKIFLAAMLAKRLYPVLNFRRGDKMLKKSDILLQITAQKDPGPYVSFTNVVAWLENGKAARQPQESVHEFTVDSGFEAAGKKYKDISQLSSEKCEKDGFYRDIYGRQVFEVTERFPCFDSYDYLNEDRYYRWFYIQEDGKLCCVYHADSRKEIKVTEDVEKVNDRSFKAMKEADYCICIEE